MCLAENPGPVKCAEVFGFGAFAEGLRFAGRTHAAGKGTNGHADTGDRAGLFRRFVFDGLRREGRRPAPALFRKSATMVTTADTDDRVFPAHSFKYAAALQEAQGGDAPILIRVETKAGHGAGKPISKSIQEQADIYGFLVKSLGMKVN
jgi:hypothetical protein